MILIIIKYRLVNSYSYLSSAIHPEQITLENLWKNPQFFVYKTLYEMLQNLSFHYNLV